MLKKVPNIFNYSIINCLIFLFQSKKISCIFNCGVTYFFFNLKRFLAPLIVVSLIVVPSSYLIVVSLIVVPSSYFFSLKRFLKSLTMVFPFFLSFPSLELFIIIFCEKIN